MKCYFCNTFIQSIFYGVLCCFFATYKCDSVDIIELNAAWTLNNQNYSIIKENLKLPSGVYSALYGEDVLQSYNDINMRWIAYDNWTYINAFQVNRTDLNYVRYINLTFHGIDTIAEIRLNHRFVGRTDNMFVRYTYDITDILQEDNTLEVEIKSPVYAALEKAKALAVENKQVPPDCPNSRYHGECHMNMLRKMQASFAWDWGLAAPSMGLWKKVQLEYYEIALIRDIDVVNVKNETHWNMHISVFIDANEEQDFYAELIFYAVELLQNPVVISDYTAKPISYLAPVIIFEQAIPIENVRTWWPNGNGEQKLYPLHFTLNAWLDDAGPNQRAKTKSNKSIKVGFRTIELVEETAPEGDGNTFMFKINDIEIFMKGSNYIPSHILPELGNDQERLKNLLQSARDANMNMLRVWGGGVYESDYFYDLADQYGILIWQDMMFACAMYPVTEDYLASVRMETIQNARRFAHHPSIAIIVTNNENEVALVDDWYKTLHENERFKMEYRQLYLANVIHELKLIEHSARPKPLVSSPSNGKESEKDNYISDDPQSTHYGDVHFYDFLKDGWNPDIYPRPRFASEYGYQSLPGLFAWERSVNDGDDLLSLMSHRQHHPLAMLPITSLVHRHLPLPLPEADNYPEALIYFSQIAQAMATKVETELYRSLRDTQHRTMGALYWQLNDVWVAPSWSSIDFYGNWKLLHHWAKEFLAPISIVALYDTKNQAINISLICDQLVVDADNLQVSANVYLWSELFNKTSTSWPVTLRSNGVQYDKVIPLSELLIDGLTTHNSFIEFELKRERSIISRTYYFPSSIAAATGIGDPELQLEISSNYCASNSNGNTLNTYSLTITVRRPAIFVYIEILLPIKYKLSENGYMQVFPVHVIYLEFENANECAKLTRDNVKVRTVNQFMI